MLENIFDTFIELVEFDQDTRKIQKEIEKATITMDEMNAQVCLLEHAIVQAKKRMVEAHKAVSEAELEIKAQDQNEGHLKTTLEKTSSHKEYEVIKSQLNQVQRIQTDLEASIIEGWNYAELVEKEYETLCSANQKIIQTLQATIQSKQEIVQGLQYQLDVRKNTRPDKEKNVPAEWLEKYSAMANQVEDPVVSLEGSACSACFYQLTNQSLTQLNRRALLQCRGCFRFLYSAEAMRR